MAKHNLNIGVIVRDVLVPDIHVRAWERLCCRGGLHSRVGRPPNVVLVDVAERSHVNQSIMKIVAQANGVSLHGLELTFAARASFARAMTNRSWGPSWSWYGLGE